MACASVGHSVVECVHRVTFLCGSATRLMTNAVACFWFVAIADEAAVNIYV